MRWVSMLAYAAVIAAGWSFAALAGSIQIHPIQHNSIYSESDNSNALGSLFAGTTPRSSVRRALLNFDLAASGIPAGATITAVSLDLTQTKIGPGASAAFELRPLLADWGQGTSSGTGSGGSPTAGDATWNYSFFNSTLWTTPGGNFGSTSGTAMVGSANSVYTFSTQAQLVGDVQRWLDMPDSNFGWILMASDETAVNAREFGSLESSVAQQPTLTVGFSAVPEPGTGVLIVIVGMAALARRQHPRTLQARARSSRR
jgi:hypothetical protein